MKTIRTKVYLFNELNDKAKEAAVNELREINVFYDWWTDTYEDAGNIKLKITSFNIDGGNYCNGEFMEDAENTAMLILKEHGKNCNTYKTASYFIDDRNKIEFEDDKEDEKLGELERIFLINILADYKQILKDESEGLTTDESIISTIEANEYYFLQNGKQFPNN